MPLKTVAAVDVASPAFLGRADLQSTTDVQCDPSFDWAKNSDGLSPCAVGAAALAVCSSTHSWRVPKLTPGNTYSGPSADEANGCQCSTITFSLLAACSLCQDARPLAFGNWSANCKSSDISINNFPFTNITTEFPLWSRGNTTSTGEFDLVAAKRIAGVPDDSSNGLPVRDIVLIALGIASAFFILFLVVFCYCRRRPLPKFMGSRKHRSKGSYTPLDPALKHGRVKSAKQGMYSLDLDAPRSSQHTSFASTSSFDDPFGRRDDLARSQAQTPQPARPRSGPYSDTKPYAGPSTTSLPSSTRTHPSDNMMKHPASSSSVNVLQRDSTSSMGSQRTETPQPPRPAYAQPLTSPPATQVSFAFGTHPAHHHERTDSSTSFGSHPAHHRADSVATRHRTTPSSSSVTRGYEQGPSSSLFSRTRQVANAPRANDFSIDGPSSSAPGPGVLSPTSAYSLNVMTARGGRAESLEAVVSPSDATGATLVHPGPARMVVPPSTDSATLVSHHGRIESHHAHVEGWESARSPDPTPRERDPFATLRALAVAPEPDLSFDLDASSVGHGATDSGTWRARQRDSDLFGDDYRRR